MVKKGLPAIHPGEFLGEILEEIFVLARRIRRDCCRLPRRPESRSTHRSEIYSKDYHAASASSRSSSHHCSPSLRSVYFSATSACPRRIRFNTSSR